MLDIVPPDRLMALAGPTPTPETTAHATNGLTATVPGSFDIDEWIATYAPAAGPAQAWPGGGTGARRWVFKVCPFNEDHRNSSACITQHSSGRLGFMCQHDGCDGKDWHALRRLMEGATPASRERRTAARATADAPPASEKRAITTRLSDVETERLAWLWWSRLLLGKLNIVDGDPGQGKTTMLLDIAARVTTERDMPDHSPGVLGGVVILTAEDGLADTIRPRLENAGADLTRCVAITDIVEGDDTRLPSIPADLDMIEDACRAIEAKLVIVDPLMAYLDERVNSNRDQDVRRALRSLARLAETTGAAVVCIRHLNKMAGGNALYRGGGSIGIIGAARSGLVVAPHPEDATRHIVASTKCNLAAPPPSLVYRLEEAGNGLARVVWEGQTEHSASDLLGQPADEEERSALDEAKDFLRDTLAAGRRASLDVKREARQAGIRDKTLRRAREALAITPEREGFGPGSVVYWGLPASAIDAHADHRCPSHNDGQVWAPMGNYGRNGQRDTCYACGRQSWHTWPDGSRVCTHCHPLASHVAGKEARP